VSDGRIAFARWAATAARLTFGVLVIAMPLRARADVLPHPPSSVSAVLNDLVIYAIDVVALAVLGLWLLARALDRRPIRLGPWALRLPAAGLVALAWLTIPFGIEPAVSVVGAIRLTAGVVLALYVLNEVDGLASLAVPIGLMLVIQAIVALGQAVAGGSLGLAWLGELSLDPGAVGTSVVTLPDGTRLLRAYGLSPHPNILGGFLACGSLLLLGVRTGSSVARVAWAATVAAAAVALVVTFSRGAWIGAAAGLGVGVVLLGLRRRRPATTRWLAGAGLVLVVALSAGWLARDAIASRIGLVAVPAATEQRSVDERLAQIRLGWRVVLERPLTGAGSSAVPIAMHRLEPDFAYDVYPPHLVVLTVAGELGVAGGLAYLWLFAAPWVLLAHVRPRWTVELAAASAALAALTVVSLVDDYPWAGGPGRTLGWFVLGLWAMAWVRNRAAADGLGVGIGRPAMGGRRWGRR
jgi:O-Antigen ligase